MLNRESPLFRHVNAAADIARVAEAMRRETVLGVDLEADSMYHFREKVCLVQMATPDTTVVIDPLQGGDLTVLGPVFADPGIRKIMHGADYDIRSLYRDFRIEINHLFDTELAARFLGLKESGLEAVLRHKFGVQLDKRFQRKDWSRRPLPDDMVAYAAGDVHYLIPLAEHFRAELRAKGRLAWVEEECAALTRVRAVGNGDGPLYLGFKGAGKLRPRNLAALEGLLQFRRRVAEEKDRPLFKVLGNNVLLALATEMPTSPKALEAAGALSAKQIGMFGQGILTALREAEELPDERLPVYPRTRIPRLSSQVPARILALKDWRDRTAERLDMDPGLVLNKTLITEIARRCPRQVDDLAAIEDLRIWRREVFGGEIVAVLARQRG
jgi:ribonuclease D